MDSDCGILFGHPFACEAMRNSGVVFATHASRYRRIPPESGTAALISKGTRGHMVETQLKL